MTVLVAAGLLALVLPVLAALRCWRDRRAARLVGQHLRELPATLVQNYDEALVAGLPDLARRYFAQAILPGTPLQLKVELQMQGSFALNGRELPLIADQISVLPAGFVWRASIGSGLMRISGSDGYLASGPSWTRFWLNRLVPLVHAGGSVDHARSCMARMASEAVWNPAALLPQNGCQWRALAADRAEVSFPALPEIRPVEFRFGPDDRITEILTERWSDANPEKTFKFQPFGGKILEWSRVQGFLIPTRVEIGNFFGTAQYQPFFKVQITSAHFW